MSAGDAANAKTMTIIVTKGSLDWAYPPFILATTAAAMGVDVTMFFTFYGLPLLLKKLDLQVTPLGNPAMKMPMMGMHMAMPNIVGMLPGVTAGATTMMKNLIAKKGVASIEDLREAAIESDVKMIACQMTMDLFEYKLEDMIDGPTLGGAADIHGKRPEVRHQSLYLIQFESACTGVRYIRGASLMAEQVLDAQGLNCPLPILKAKKALKDLPTGGTLRVLATDPGSVADFAAFCRTTGNELLESRQDGKTYNFLIKRSA